MIKLSNKKENTLEYKCSIRLLDDNDVIECEFQNYQKGRYLLDHVFNKLDLIETDYFGLRFVDHNKQRHWLDPNKNILRQIKNLNPILFCFRVKFYPMDPMKLHEEITRYYLFLQLRRDLLHGRLYCTPSDAAILAAYIVQADLGDYNSEDYQDNYISDYKILLKQTPKIEEKITDIHKSLKGLSPSFSELYFLKKASALDTYGVDPNTVKDHKGLQLYLGLNHSGVLTFQGSRRTHHFRWNEVQKLNYEGKMFIIHLLFMEDARTKRKHTVGFKCPSASSCRHLWRAAVEQRLFYTMNNSNKHGVVVTGGSFFSRGSRFRYQGRCEKEVVEDSATILRDPPKVKRVSLKNVGRSASLPSTPADSDNYDSVMSRVHRPLPYIDRSTSLDEEVLCGAETSNSPPEPRTNGSFKGSMGAYCPESTLPPLSFLEPLLEANEAKSRSSSCLENTMGDHEAADDATLYGRTLPSYSPKKSNKDQNANKDLESLKRGFRREYLKERSDAFTASEDHDFMPHQSLCDCSGQNDLADSSSTETLSPPTEPLDNLFQGRNGHYSLVKQRKLPQSHSLPFHASLSTDSESGSLQRAKSRSPEHPTSLSMTPCTTGTAKSNKERWLRYRWSIYRFIKVFFTVLTFVLFILSFIVILLCEYEFSFFENLRNARELVLFRVQYYQPLRQFLIRSVGMNTEYKTNN